jgi:hypothetical protein
MRPSCQQILKMPEIPSERCVLRGEVRRRAARRSGEMRGYWSPPWSPPAGISSDVAERLLAGRVCPLVTAGTPNYLSVTSVTIGMTGGGQDFGCDGRCEGGQQQLGISLR